ncbi:MAG: gamma carbonic anhydrase family protein, partial [Christensenellaceae bacterium]
MITKVKGRNPQIAQTAFVHISAVVIGDVVLKEHASVWPCAVLRGDMSQIIIGENSNVQDNSVLHTNADMPLVVGDHVVIAHGANLHSCEIGENSIVGIGAIV